MTRGAMKIRVAQLLSLTLGDGAYGDHFALDNALNRVADEFASCGLYGYWGQSAQNIASGTALVTASQFFKLRSANWVDGSGNISLLLPTTPVKMDINVPGWRSSTPSATLRYFVFQGAQSYLLYPTPNFTRTNALLLEGFEQVSVNGVNAWATDTTECPLPSWTHDAIVCGAAFDLVITMIGSGVPEEVSKGQLLQPLVQARYTELRTIANKVASEYYAGGLGS